MFLEAFLPISYKYKLIWSFFVLKFMLIRKKIGGKSCLKMLVNLTQSVGEIGDLVVAILVCHGRCCRRWTCGTHRRRSPKQTCPL